MKELLFAFASLSGVLAIIESMAVLKAFGIW